MANKRLSEGPQLTQAWQPLQRPGASRVRRDQALSSPGRNVLPPETTPECPRRRSPHSQKPESEFHLPPPVQPQKK